MPLKSRLGVCHVHELFIVEIYRLGTVLLSLAIYVYLQSLMHTTSLNKMLFLYLFALKK